MTSQSFHCLRPVGDTAFKSYSGRVYVGLRPALAARRALMRCVFEPDYFEVWSCSVSKDQHGTVHVRYLERKA